MKKNSLLLPIFLLLVFLNSCSNPAKKVSEQELSYQKLDSLVLRANFQKEIDGKKVDLFTLKNDSGVTVKITNYGARLVSILQPDKNKIYEDVLLGYSTIDEYLKDAMYMGGIIGRFANRIAKGTYTIDGKKYTAPLNNGPNALHGGLKGFDNRIWEAKQEGNVLTLNYTAADGEEGYPGEMKVTAIYELTKDNVLRMTFTATSNKKTIVNLTNHGWFNMAGEESADLYGHEMEVNADYYTPVDSTLIPLGQIAPVEGTPFDFRKPDMLVNKINKDVEQMKHCGKGFDHNWVLNGKNGEMKLAMRFIDTKSGRAMEVSTTEPGLQMYSSNHQNGSVKGKKKKGFARHAGMAIEPQHYPDSPNQKDFPTTILNPGETYKFVSEYKFYTK